MTYKLKKEYDQTGEWNAESLSLSYFKNTAPLANGKTKGWERYYTDDKGGAIEAKSEAELAG